MITQSAIENSIISKLTNQQSTLQNQWNNAGQIGTRYFVIDGLLPKKNCLEIFDGFPHEFEHCRQIDTFRERKKTLAQLNKVDPIISAAIHAFHVPAVIQGIEDITGIRDLKADPNLYAGGISMMGKGDFLNPHIDNSHDFTKQHYRRLNLLYYVSPNWMQENGGNLELWDDAVNTPLEITAVFNRLVVMETTHSSWHSVNEVRANKTRCCVSNYYFSKESPTEQEYYHVTSFTGRPRQTVQRCYGKIDNALRQFVAERLKIKRKDQLINK